MPNKFSNIPHTPTGHHRSVRLEHIFGVRFLLFADYHSLFAAFALFAVLIPFAVYCLPFTASAASFSLAVGTAMDASGDAEYALILRADAPVNAVSATIAIPPDVAVTDISDAGSPVQFWIENPHEDAERHTIVLAGIIPGGWSGGGVVARWRAKAGTVFTIDKKEMQALLHDGEGTPDPIVVGPVEPMPAEFALGAVADTDPPREFAPIAGEDPALFGGQPFVSFGTGDAGGAVRYQIAEFDRKTSPDDPSLSWRDAVSPTAISSDGRYIYVRAIDAAGNSRVSVLPPDDEKVDKLFSSKRIVLAIMSITAIGVGFVLWRKRRNAH